MRNKLTLLLLAAVMTTGISCKKDTTGEAETKDAVETKRNSKKAKKYIVDTANSTIHWTGSKPTGNHTGKINISDGEIYVNKDSIDSGKFTINMKSIVVTDLTIAEGKEDLENHLKGIAKESDKADHFFNTNKYPTGTFEITAVTKENSKSSIEGNLTLKGVTKNIKFPAKVTITADAVNIESDDFKINRILWNINYSSKSVFDNLGNQYIDDDIELKVRVNAKRAKNKK